MSVESSEACVVALIVVTIIYLYLGVTGNKKSAAPDT